MADPRTAILVRELEELEDEITIRSCELAERSFDGFTVQLMFDPQSEVHPLYVVLSDPDGERRSFPVPADKGLDAFAHPHAYAP